jgi:hypothetical protein
MEGATKEEKKSIRSVATNKNKPMSFDSRGGISIPRGKFSLADEVS